MIVSQSYVEKHADIILPSGSKESVILNIDEDFFSCARGSDSFTSAGLDWIHAGRDIIPLLYVTG